jgi:hypothetical protein
MTRLAVAGWVVFAATGASAADTAAVSRERELAPALPEDATRELKWDNGTRKFLVYWYTGEGSWVGNDFADLMPGRDTSGGPTRIVSIKIYTSAKWPNERWDGFRVAIYGYNNYNSTPGEMLWPTGGTGYYFKPSRPGDEGWVNVPVNWVASPRPFIAAMEQAYNAPDCDPFAVDSNPRDLGHTWSYYNNQWRRLESTADPYRNLMLRVLTEDLPYQPAVAPLSFGRVRALYR